MMKYIISAFVFVAISFCSLLAQENSNAFLKVQYKSISHERYPKGDENTEIVYDYILQVAPERSFFYDPQKFYCDSMENDPNGKAIKNRIETEALHESFETGKNWFEILKAKGFGVGNSTKCIKDFSNRSITVYDSTFGEKHVYDVAMEDLIWIVGDSVKTVLGYDCIEATADYHGRKWAAWFAPEIPIPDGPWQLCGLPGLIMEAVTDDCMYSFEVTGLQKVSEPLKPVFNADKYMKSSRLNFLRSAGNFRYNKSSMLKSMTGVNVSGKVGDDNVVDLIETDYRR